MIINSEPKDKATFGGVGAVSEFKIRNSAKAFGILSSGLYANKIRAIIRELSCNAVDSHVAAGTTVNFDLHLPTQLAPYFSVRDYGTGLSHDEVSSIYTTYFESTKTESNDFIGALGLGSKSPFSYTDNFSVIAIKDGMKGVYSAFINDHGVPSVVQMGHEPTDESNGVEVKFAVTERHDFYSFQDEARHVFTYFPIKPNFVGAECDIKSVVYIKENLVPGVNQRTTGGYSNQPNLAVMGNIAYPIQIPRGAMAQFTEFSFVEGQGLDLHFALGEIEFQASREGLQYTDKTVDAIKAKYQEIAQALEAIVATDAEAIENMWDRQNHLAKLGKNQLWSKVVARYVSNNNVPFFAKNNPSYLYEEAISLSPKKLAEKYNISLRMFDVDRNYNGHDRIARERLPRYEGTIDMHCLSNIYFVKNPHNEKIWTRAKEHFKSQYKDERRCFLISAVDPVQPVDFDGFAEFIHSPPEERFLDVADLNKPVRKKNAEKISILRVDYDRYSQKCTWQGMQLQVADMDLNETYYYVPIKGFQGTTKAGKHLDVKAACSLMRRCGVEKLEESKVYGVRTADLETVRGLSNWIQLDDLIDEVLNSYKADDFLGLVLSWVDNNKQDLYYDTTSMEQLDPKSPMRLLHNKLPESPVHGSREVFDLASYFDGEHNLKELEEEAKEEIAALRDRYPMFALIRGRVSDDPAVIEYIQIVDQQKGLN
jgi:hypothetical protein